MAKYISLLLLLTIVLACDSNNEELVDVSSVQVDFTIDRFDTDFYSSTAQTLPETKEKYPFFFTSNDPDSVWINKIKDADERALFAETQKLYKDISFLRVKLELLFQHVKYYFPEFKTPKVITLLSNIDYQNKVLYTKDYLLISLDVYLGATHDFYADFPEYIKQNFTKNQIIVDVASAVVTDMLKNQSSNRNFVSRMIQEGKKQYLFDKYLPSTSDASKIGFSDEKHAWAIANEQQIWKYFIEHKLLFSTDTKLAKRFLDDAPFSKFYRSEDTRSPGRIGAWMGRQIVRSYMKYNDVSLQELIVTSTEEIYKKSKYKPKK